MFGIYLARKDHDDTEFQPSAMAAIGDVDKPWMAAGIRPSEPDSTRLYLGYLDVDAGLLGAVIWSDDM
ncbi:MAG: hypothetical protein R3190_14605, partial [Thermoanaerobaculia bacterium]|nr:hypothetical protein [Thermoanaerobaculia bacterium]